MLNLSLIVYETVAKAPEIKHQIIDLHVHLDSIHASFKPPDNVIKITNQTNQIDSFI